MTKTPLLPRLARPALRLAAAASVAVAGMAATSQARAETELSFYLGSQEAAHSRVRGNDPTGIGSFNFLSAWQGKSFEPPPYYGVRATWWRTENLGFGVDFNHVKVYASDSTKSANGLKTLEFTDGLNVLTANIMYRWPNTSRFTPYVGAGVGITIPHVEFQSAGTGQKTFEYQYGGPAAAVIAGVNYSLTDTWSVFGEYKGTYSQNDVDLEGGGSLKTDIVTNAVNLGVSFGF